MGSRLLALLATASFAALVQNASANDASVCTDMLSPSWSVSSTGRSVDPKALATLLDVGQPTSNSALEGPPFSLSPDGQSLAFLLRRADPANNRYCQGIFLLDLASRDVRALDIGGEPVRMEVPDLRGLRMTTGVLEQIVPTWSPDGRYVAFRRKDNGVVQIWRAAANGSGSRSITHFEADVERFAWIDHDKIVVASSEPLAAWRDAMEKEGLAGFRYGRRFMPMASLSRPLPPAGLGAMYSVVATESGETRDASKEEIAQLGPLHPNFLDENASQWTIRKRGGGAWLAPQVVGNPASPTEIRARVGNGPTIPCKAMPCSGIIAGLWWDENEDELLFLTLAGWGNSHAALYRWRPGKRNPARIFDTTDLLGGCIIAREQLLCTREDARNPRTIASIDVRSGKSKTLFEPNPQFKRLARGKVERLEWRNRFGFEAFGYLLLPPQHRAGESHPLIVVQYLGKGFMRGGVGDEYPAHAFAARGYAVLMVQRPAHYSDSVFDPSWRAPLDATRADTQDWADRRSSVSSLMTGIEVAVKKGVVDPARIGLTGMSDGAATAMFAINSNPGFFAAVSLSTCCQDPGTDFVMVGPAWEESRRKIGYPGYSNVRDFYRPISLASNAASIRSPILLQLADDEVGQALETYVTFRDLKRPLDLYIFPDEHHAKWQPAHRLAIYERNLDWFDFWLRDHADPATDKREQYAHWRMLRAQASAAQP